MNEHIKLKNPKSVHKYELFKMMSDKSISCMFNQFTDTISTLKSLKKMLL